MNVVALSQILALSMSKAKSEKPFPRRGIQSIPLSEDEDSHSPEVRNDWHSTRHRFGYSCLSVSKPIPVATDHSHETDIMMVHNTMTDSVSIAVNELQQLRDCSSHLFGHSEEPVQLLQGSHSATTQARQLPSSSGTLDRVARRIRMHSMTSSQSSSCRAL